MGRLSRASAVASAILLSSVIAQDAPKSTVSFAYPSSAAPDAPHVTANVLDTVYVEWTSNYDQARIILWCDEYRAEDDNMKRTYAWLNQTVNPSDTIKYTPWDFVATDKSNTNRTGKYPIFCHFDLLWGSGDEERMNGGDLHITSIPNHQVATTFARLATQVGPTPGAASATPSPSSPSNSTSENTASPSYSSSTPTSSPPATNTQAASNSALSTGAKAGIGAGVAIAVLAIATLLYLFYRNHRKLKDIETRVATPKDDMPHIDSPHSDSPISTYYHTKHVHKQPVWEIDTAVPVPEMSGVGHVAHELPALAEKK